MQDGLPRRSAHLRLVHPMLVLMGFILGGAFSAGGLWAAPPVVAGYHVLKEDAKAEPGVLGELLLSELNCTACHKAEGQPRVAPKGAPDLGGIGARATPQWIRAYLADPHGVKPGATMPDIFHASEAEPKKGAVEFLTHFLVSQGGPIKPASVEGNLVIVDQGRNLYHTVGCVACHAPEKEIETKVPSVPLGKLSDKYTVDSLSAFLLDPLKTRPHGRMPSSNLTPAEATAISVYLVREQMDNPQVVNAPPARTRGLSYTFYDVNAFTAAVDKIDPLIKGGEGRVETFNVNIPGRPKEDGFAYKFSGAIAIPKDGKYTFYTKSDDGSMLYVDDKLVVNNDGTHSATEKSGSVDLKAGDHPIVVTFFEGSGGAELEVQWEGPGIPRQTIPADVLFRVGGRPMIPLGSGEFAVDPQRAQMGGQMFGVLGCASCHAAPNTRAVREAKPLAAINVDSPDGCLSESVRKGLPKYDLSAEQRGALAAAVKNASNLATPLDDKQQVVRTMAAMNCYACHRRDEIGGAAPGRTDYFLMVGSFDMGDEGRYPPRLSEIGRKLKTEAIDQIVFEGKLHVRPVLATRMPRFSKQTAGNLIDGFAKADGAADEPPSAFDEKAAKDGRTLVGTKGLGCVNCHGVGDVNSLGMPSVNLSTVHARLRRDWFHELLADPPAKNPQTRMPGFWPGGVAIYPDIAGGQMASQIAAIRAYTSLGKSMPLPSGLQPTGGYELIPVDEPIVHRTFMAEVGPRAVLVGFPDQLSVAFDANVVRLAKAWRGKFFDAKGMWEGRGGQANGPLGTDVINFPPGPAFAVLASPDAAWPVPKDNQERNLGGRFHGYRLDKDLQPVFRYSLNGVEIEEQPVPVLQAGGPALVRRFSLSTKEAAPTALHFLAAGGAKIESKSPGSWIIDDKLTVTITSPAKLAPTVREAGGARQLLVPIPFENGKASFEVEMKW